MCGRYTLSTVDGPEIAQRFGLMDPPVPETLGRANICPTEEIAVVWYEWLKAERKGEPRIPFRYTVDGGVVFAFAGLYDGTGAAILTGPANEVCAPVHDRMPCV